ncbi:hypothetical protein M514_01661 [Trichuris suis]|uniref:Uncharacterized protein n=1 Tax=Trichuris suis TaxID=68888 RepID=A0A085MK12_9BILA|nr:hypothetical protein M513_01661 [Trichuris suis]KFD64847.1 hypothetical protein M514_01661 [Trichuris suis]
MKPCLGPWTIGTKKCSNMLRIRPGLIKRPPPPA